METAVETVRLLCPQYDVSEQIGSLINRTKFDLPVQQLPKIACGVAAFEYSSQYFSEHVLLWGQLAGAILCVLSAALSLTSLHTKPFDASGFIFYKALNWAEIVHGIFMVFNFALRYAKNSYKRIALFSFYAAHFFARMEQFVPFFIELCVLWAATVLAVGFAFPRVHDKLNSGRAAWPALCLLALLSVALFIPSALIMTVSYNPARDDYSISKTEFGSSSSVVIYETVLASVAALEAALFLIAVLSTCATAIANNRKHKRLLYGEYQLSAADQQNILKIIRSNRILCAFQLLESIPLLLSCFLTAIFVLKRLETSLDSLIQMPFTEASWNNHWLYISIWLIPIQYFCSLFVHCTHFARYYMFSRVFRQATGQVWRECCTPAPPELSSTAMGISASLGYYPFRYYSSIEQYMPGEEDDTYL